MLGVSTPEMAAAVSNAGGLGSLPIGGLSPEQSRKLIQQTKSLTDKPFAVNLFAHNIPEYTVSELKEMQQFMFTLSSKRGYTIEDPGMEHIRFYNHLDQVALLIEEQVQVVSFTFGCLDKDSIHRLKQKGCILIGTATCVAEAAYLQEQQIDMIAIQGIEAGGHRGTFMDDIPLPQIGLLSLLPQIREAVSLPCIASGAINTAAAMQAAFALGADAVQIGTAFIGTKESIAIDAYKDRLREAKDTDTVLTKAFSGRWARGIRNELMQAIEASGMEIPPYPLQNTLTTMLRKQAQQHNDADYTNLWAGQSAGGTHFDTSKEVFLNLVQQFEAAKGGHS